MPYRKRAYKKKRRPRKRYVAKNRPARIGFSRFNPVSIYQFKRKREVIWRLNTNSPPTDPIAFVAGTGSSAGNIGAILKFSLSDLPGSSGTDLTNLFKWWRIKGVRVRLYFSNTNSDASNRNTALINDNSQLLVRMDRNQTGEQAITSAAQNETYLYSQTSKIRTCLNGGRPLDFYIPVKQLGQTFGNTPTPGVTDEIASMQSPRWIPSTEPDLKHFGVNICIQRVDGAPLTTGYTTNQACRAIMTYYIQCKKVE